MRIVYTKFSTLYLSLLFLLILLRIVVVSHTSYLIALLLAISIWSVICITQLHIQNEAIDIRKYYCLGSFSCIIRLQKTDGADLYLLKIGLSDPEHPFGNKWWDHLYVQINGTRAMKKYTIICGKKNNKLKKVTIRLSPSEYTKIQEFILEDDYDSL